MHNTPLDPQAASVQAQALAAAVGEALYARDPASKALGMQIVEMRAGYARMSMTIRPDMLNGHQNCHGGFIFTLADSAFAFACNSHNINTVGAACSIDYLAPGRLGDVLTAEAVEQVQTGRSGVYDVTIRNQENRIIALFRGKSHRVGGEILPTKESQETL
ncbi:hydroxyphenylacetyl-CoA thioesterase PaaI [Duganella fentianensis]|uniref:hydroxyphenylacetyl-CoA thioesterase PaaI n=1 Tax=Duganella fentianensis TaxID=2692177 RepID=UPI0032B1719F